MRNKSSFVIAAAMLAVCLGPVARAEQVPAAIQARYNSLIAIVLNRDLKRYDAFYPAVYVSVDPTGKTSNRAKYLHAAHDLFKGAKAITIDLKFTGVTRHAGIVDVAFDCRGTITGPSGKTTFHEVGTDSWKKIGKVWTEIRTVDKVMDVITPKAIG